MDRKARWTAAAVAATTVVCMAGTAAASAGPSPDVAKARAIAAAKGKPAEDRAKVTQSLAKVVAAQLGVSLSSAREAVNELFTLADRPHGVDPDSAEFVAIAGQLGVSPARFDKALAAAKQALGKQVAVKKGEHDDKGKPGDGKPVIKHTGPDDAAAMTSLAKAVAAHLGVGTAPAEHAVKELFTLADRPNGVNPHSAEFAAVARELGVGPARFEKALSAAKQGLADDGRSSKG
ncbi:hypothetical protein ACFYXS_05125 [Streptomyces sp. NPDC002574]|uniref:hypothetical protein n=1 Tax=Streptomyces sp. NPDC002574 TaxID=3364652 RepID=UPI0036C07198